MEKNRLLNFNYIGNKYHTLVFDTCAIRGYTTGSVDSRTVEDRGFFKTLTHGIRVYNCIVPQVIIDELAGINVLTEVEKRDKGELMITAYNHNKKLEESLGRLGIDLIGEVEKEFRQDYDRCSKFTNISPEDLEVFEYAKVLAKHGSSSAIVSNDFRGPCKVWRDYVKTNDIDVSGFGCFARRPSELFEELNII